MKGTKSVNLDVDNGGSILLLNGDRPESERQSCVDLLSLIDPGRANLLVVTYHESPDEWFHRWTETIGERPAEIGMISVGEITRSSAAIEAMPSAQSGVDVPISTVSATALTELGIAVGRFLADWSDNPNRTVVCFDSITGMLQWTELEPAFRFLHVLEARLEGARAISHFHCDPTVHDATTIGVLEQLFDHVIDGSEHQPVEPDFFPSLDRRAVMDALHSARRRIVLDTLIDRPGYVSIKELADEVVASSMRSEEADATPATERQRAMTQLHHTDLPKLAEAGLVTYDSEENVAALAIPSSHARSYLDGYNDS